MKIVQVLDPGPGLFYVGTSTGAHAAGTVVLADDGTIWRLDVDQANEGGVPPALKWSAVELPALPEPEPAAE